MMVQVIRSVWNKGHGKTLAYVVMLILVTAGVSWVFAPSIAGRGFDREVFRYMGMLILQGGRPYVDAFDHHFPLVFFFAAIVHPFGPWGLWALDLLFVAGAAVAVMFILRRAPEFIRTTMPFVVIVWLRFAPIAEGGAMTRGFAASLFLMGVSVLLQGGRLRFLLAGVITGAVAMMQVEVSLLLVPWVLWALQEETSVRKAFVEFVASAMAIPLLMLGWLQSFGALKEFWFCMWDFNHMYMTSGASLRERLGLLMESIWKLNLLPLFLVSALSFFCNPSTQKYAWPALWSTGLSVLLVMLSSRFYGHYFLPVVACLILLVSIKFLQMADERRRRLLIILLFAACVVPVARVTKDAIYAYRNRHMNLYNRILASWDDVLEPIRGQKGKFFVFQGQKAVALWTDYEIVSPTKWIYSFVWDQFSAFDIDQKRFASMIQDLQNAKTEYILDYSQQFPMVRNELQRMWNGYMVAQYVVIRRMVKGAILWKRRSAPKRAISFLPTAPGQCARLLLVPKLLEPSQKEG